mmetsp:Transcript_14714/g.55456  ORF Transcript_14714/g.55456 Transcript_14714/m.55456 type:complete len:630 (+) Transcript_14714:342-2231(+)
MLLLLEMPPRGLGLARSQSRRRGPRVEGAGVLVPPQRDARVVLERGGAASGLCPLPLARSHARQPLLRPSGVDRGHCAPSARRGCPPQPPRPVAAWSVKQVRRGSSCLCALRASPGLHLVRPPAALARREELPGPRLARPHRHVSPPPRGLLPLRLLRCDAGSALASVGVAHRLEASCQRFVVARHRRAVSPVPRRPRFRGGSACVQPVVPRSGQGDFSPRLGCPGHFRCQRDAALQVVRRRANARDLGHGTALAHRHHHRADAAPAPPCLHRLPRSQRHHGARRPLFACLAAGPARCPSLLASLAAGGPAVLLGAVAPPRNAWQTNGAATHWTASAAVWLRSDACCLGRENEGRWQLGAGGPTADGALFGVRPAARSRASRGRQLGGRAAGLARARLPAPPTPTLAVPSGEHADQAGAGGWRLHPSLASGRPHRHRGSQLWERLHSPQRSGQVPGVPVGDPSGGASSAALSRCALCEACIGWPRRLLVRLPRPLPSLRGAVRRLHVPLSLGFAPVAAASADGAVPAPEGGALSRTPGPPEAKHLFQHLAGLGAGGELRAAHLRPLAVVPRGPHQPQMRREALREGGTRHEGRAVQRCGAVGLAAGCGVEPSALPIRGPFSSRQAQVHQ